MYYALWCLDNFQYMNIGLNSQSREDVRQSILNYVEDDVVDDGWESVKKWTLEQLCEYWNFELHKNSFRF